MKCFFRFKETNSELFEKGRLVVFTNDFFTVYQDTSTGEMNISLNEIGNFSFYQSALRHKFTMMMMIQCGKFFPKIHSWHC